jgi:hypothetical protein
VHEVERVTARERRVLEVAEQREHAEDAEREHPLARIALQQAAARVRDRGRPGHQRREPPVGVGVEVVARPDDPEQPQAMVRNGEVADDDGRQEEVEEREAVEEHAGG